MHANMKLPYDGVTVYMMVVAISLLILNMSLIVKVCAFCEHCRINNDLLLWEPTAPSPVETVECMPYGVGLSVASQLINTYSKDSFSQFRSTGIEGEIFSSIYGL